MTKKREGTAASRLEALFDDGEYTELAVYAKENDSPAAVVTAYGYVNGNPVYAFSQDPEIDGGAVGPAHAKKISKLYDLAAETGCPVVGIHDSDGAYIDGSAGALSLYSELLAKSARISGVVPQISVIAGSCTGCQAVLAACADVCIVSEKSDVFMSSLADSRELSKTSAVSAAETSAAIEAARKIINLLPVNNLAGAPIFEEAECTGSFDGTAESAESGLCDPETFVELYSGMGGASTTALASLKGQTVGLAFAGKGGSELDAEDAAKLSRFVRMCDAFTIPVITFIDTKGFATGGAAELRLIAQLSASYSEATTPKIAVVTGTAIGPVFTALAGKDHTADIVYADEAAVIAPLAPLAAVEFIWHDKLKGAENLTEKREELAAEYISTNASALAAAECGAVDDIVLAEDLREELGKALDMLSGKRVRKLPKKHNNIPF